MPQDYDHTVVVGGDIAGPFPAPFRRSRSTPPAEAPHRLGSTVKPLCSFGFAQALFEQNA